MGRLNSTMRGLLIPDPRLGVDGLAPNDGTPIGSDYTEQGARPGSSSSSDPNSRTVAVVQHGLSADIEIEVIGAGDPGIDGRKSARARWRFVGDSAFDFRGYAEAMAGNYWLPVVWNNTTFGADQGFDAITDKISQRVLVVHRQDGGGATDFTTARRTVGINSFEDAGTVVAQVLNPFLAAAGLDVCCTQLPSGRVLVHDQDALYYSDDAFTAAAPAWAPYSKTPTAATLATPPVGWSSDRARIHADRDGNVLLLKEQNGAGGGSGQGFVVQYVSQNLGAQFAELEAVDLGGGFGSFTSIVELPDGSLVIGYLNGLRPKVRKLATPFDLISEAIEIDVDPVLLFSVFTIWADPRGIVWASGGSPATQRLYRSEDGGETWQLERWGWWDNLGAVVQFGPSAMVATVARGICWMVHGSVGASGFEGNSLAAFRLGGWTNVEPMSDPGATVATSGLQFRRGWFDTDTGPIATHTWIPYDVPDAGGSSWLAFGATAGAIIGGATGGAMEIATAAANGGYEHPVADGAGVTLYCATSSRGAGGSLAALQHGIELITTNAAGTLATHIEIRVLSTTTEIRFRVRDIQAGSDLFELAVSSDVVGPQSIGDEPYLEFKIALEPVLLSEEIWIYYRPSDSTLWRAALEKVAVATGAVPAAGARVALGATVAGTTSQVWRAFYFRESVGVNAFRSTNSADPQRGTEIGTLPIALALAGTVDTDEALVSFRGGPAVFGESHTIPAIHDFGIGAALFDSGPSRAEKWRDTSNLSVNRTLTWVFPEATRLGGSFLLGLVILDANFDIALLEVDLVGGGAGWTTAATLNLSVGFTSLHYERHGDIIRPGTDDASTQDGARFLNRAELVGGIARWGNPQARANIIANSAGGWTDKSVNTIQPFVRVDASIVAGTDTASAGPLNELSLQAPSGLVIGYMDEQYVYGVRVVIPPSGNQDGYRSAGLIMPCVFAAFGQQWSRGYSHDTRPNVIRDESRQGTIRKRQEGPPASRISMAWADGTKLDQMRDGITPDYLGPVGKPPVVADSDVWGQLWGILDETKSGEIPVVYVAELPADGITLTDRSLFTFGTLDGSARFDHVLGDENINEFGRIAGYQVSEIK